MLLVELILFIVAGGMGFLIGRVVEWVEIKFPQTEEPPKPKPRRRGDIKAELDELLHSYRQGLLSEEQYLDQTDELIDQLSDLKQEESSLNA